MFINGMQQSPLGGFGAGGGAQGFGQNPLSAMMAQLMQMMMTIMMSQLQQMTGGGQPGNFGGPPGMGAMSPMQNPGFGGAGGGMGCPGGGSAGPGGFAPGQGMNSFLGGGRPGGLAGPSGPSSFSGPSGAPAGTPFAGVGGNQEWASKLPPALRSLAPHFQAAGQRFNVDPKFLAAISMLETGKGTSSAFRNKNNAMGVSNSRGPVRFNNPAESIYKMAQTLSRKNGPYGRANTIAQIGRIYAPPGAGNDVNGTNGTWPSGVSKYYQMLGGNPGAAVKG